MQANGYILQVAVILAVSCLGEHSEECGQRPPLPRVLGGQEAIPHSWPWQARIEAKRSKDGEWLHKCGASLIHPEWIVTAAHCLAFQPDPRIYRIILGSHDRTKQEETDQYFEVSQLFIHKRYQTISGYGHDIALIRLSRPVVLNKTVSLVCLPEQDNRVAVGTTCYLTGWGVSKRGDDTRAQKLQQVRMPTVSYSTCSKGNSFFQPIDDESMLCAGFGGSSRISGCNGDSGGPFVCQEDGRFVLRGAVSWGIPGCPAGKTFSVFTRISSFVDWVKEHIRNADNY